MIFLLASFGFKNTIKNQEVPKSLKVNEPTFFSFPKDEIFAEYPIVLPPRIGNSYIGFKEAVAFKESRGKYGVVNSLGYLGKYQFGIGTLELVGIYNPDYFLRNPKLQERAFKTNIARNKWILRKDIEKYTGLKIGNSHITESGIIAAAHLAGPGNVKKYLRSLGAHDVNDEYGSSVSHYIKKFSGYDISMIVPKRNAKI
tara:strand:- start:86602 stop:87201 length:600 start_codon:yes stop_codon:yes gene_type:complete